MKQIVTAEEVHERLDELLDGVFYHHNELVIEQDGRSVAVIIPAYLYAVIERGRGQIAGVIHKAPDPSKEPPAPSIFDAVIARYTPLEDRADAAPEADGGNDEAVEAGGKTSEQAATTESSSLAT